MKSFRDTETADNNEYAVSLPAVASPKSLRFTLQFHIRLPAKSYLLIAV